MSDNSNTQKELEEPENMTQNKTKRTWAVKGTIIFVVLGILLLLAGWAKNVGFSTYVKAVYNFVAAPVAQIASVNGRTNILVMGRAGGAHDGPDLTDTMILVSVALTKPDVVTISIPRDIWISEIRAKINAAYYWGNQNTPYFGDLKNSTGGIGFAKTITAEVVGQPIQYGIVVDFTGFKDVIDALGGIQVNVERSFTDNLYPIAGKENDTCGGDLLFKCRYQTVTFNAGSQTMNGNTALEFVRSRHAVGDEGTDTAREARQQKVIDAIKSKILKPNVFLSPKVDLAMLGVFKKYVQTDLGLPAGGVVARKILGGIKNVKQLLVPQDLLFNPPVNAVYDQQYVFIPKAGNGKWSEINQWFSSVLN
jgi:polyisoprenyl-teichoic acid--peptidoglycan teichoic acid transferase